MSLVAALVDDLMFVSRIREAAKASSSEVRTARTLDALRAAVHEGATLVLLDLDSPRLPWAEALRALSSEPDLAAASSVGFVGHANEAAIHAAREAGCGQVLPRGAFVQRLPAILAGPPQG
jgi:DNA-binding NarL/FixJ family response regulator